MAVLRPQVGGFTTTIVRRIPQGQWRHSTTAISVVTVRKAERRFHNGPRKFNRDGERRDDHRDYHGGRGDNPRYQRDGERSGFRRDDRRDGNRKDFHRDGDRRNFRREDGDRRNFHRDNDRRDFHRDG
ncbi:MAG: hypothetical protein ACLSUZ_04570, partial [Bifidobacterium pseudocatenulatum]